MQVYLPVYLEKKNCCALKIDVNYVQQTTKELNKLNIS